VNDSYGTNDPHVQHYSTAADGIHAHSSMLNQSNFNLLKAALASGDPDSFKDDPLTQAQFMHWSGSGYSWPPFNLATTPLVATADDGSGPIPSSRAKEVVKSVKGPLGIFNQTQGTATDRANVEGAATMFYHDLIAYDKKHPKATLQELIQGVTNSDNPRGYAQYKDNAGRVLSAYGQPGSLAALEATAPDAPSAMTANGSYQNLDAGGEYYFYRGNIENRLGQKIRKPENSWTCIQRLADDVDWMAFFVSGVFYYMSQDDMIKQQPALTMNEWTEGIRQVDGNFYEHKDSASLSITADVGKWMVPPGRVVVVEDMGPWDGRWLVSDFERSLFNTTATITLARERPGLPEPNPKGGNKTDIDPTWVPQPQSTAVGGSPSGAPGPPITIESPSIAGDAATLAHRLIQLYSHGWTDDHTGYQQMQATGAGKPLYFNGTEVHLDPKIIALVIYLITEKNYQIHTSAWCTDHPRIDSPRGHNGGHAVDISRLNGVRVDTLSPQCYQLVLGMDQLLNGLRGFLEPRQVISGGYGNTRDKVLASYCLPPGSETGYYDEGTLAGHCDHIHVGY
jgi:hypothetical protein